MTISDPFIIRGPTPADDAAQGLPPEHERTAAFLDELRVAESAGADALVRWAASCREPMLASMLHLVALRDADHAVLAGARRRELGGAPGGEISRALAGFCRSIASTELSDRSKLSMLLARFPAETQAAFTDEIASVGDDDETRALLHVIGDDERISLACLRELYEAAPVLALSTVSNADPGVLAFLDALAAAERTAAEVFDAWTRVCRTEGLRGGLRVLTAREATHAHVARERLHALGGVSVAQLDGGTRRDALAQFGDAAISDAAKLDVFLGRYPTNDDIAQALGELAQGATTDPITRAQLEWMAASEVATLTWLRRYRAAA